MIKQIIFGVFYIFLAVPSAFAEQIKGSFSLNEIKTKLNLLSPDDDDKITGLKQSETKKH